MSLDDYSSAIDGVFGLGPGQPVEAGGTRPAPTGGQSDQYRQALARSLNGDKPDEAVQADHTAEPSEPPEKSAVPTTDDRESEPADSTERVDCAAADRPAPTAPEVLGDSSPPQTDDNSDTSAHMTNVMEVQAVAPPPPAGLRLFVAEPDVPVITLSDDRPPEPPVNIQLLPEETTGEPNGGFTGKLVGFESDEPLSPPAGLFGLPNSTKLVDGHATPDPVAQPSEPQDLSSLSQDVAAEQSLDAVMPVDADDQPDAASIGQKATNSADASTSTDVPGTGVSAEAVAATAPERTVPTGRKVGRNDASPVTAVSATPEESAPEPAEQDSSAPIAGPRQQADQPLEGVKVAGNLANTPSADSAVDQSSATPEAVQETVRATSAVKGSPTSANGLAHEGVNNPSAILSEADAVSTPPSGSADGDPAALVERVATAIRTAQQGQGQLRARLHPPELGTIQIEVSAREGLLSVRLEVSKATTQHVLNEHMSLLHDALAQNGTRVGRIDVHLNSRGTDDGTSDSGHERQNESQQRQSGRQQQRHSDEQADDDRHRSRPRFRERHMDQLDIQI